MQASTLPATPDFRVLFESAPGLYLVLTPDLQIVAVSDAYLRATMTERKAILGRHLFEVFPDNPDDPVASGVSNLRASLGRVIRDKVPDSMAVQKYDIQRPDSEGGGFEERYWSPMNSPVLGSDGNIVYIIHRVKDVTDFVRLKNLGAEQHKRTAELQERADTMEVEIFHRAQQLQEVNQQLRKANAELATRDEERTRLFEQLSVLERKQAEEALSQSEAKFRQLAENIPEVFWMTTSDLSAVIYASPAYEKIWGRSREDLYRNPKEWLEAILPEDRTHVADSFAKLEQGASEVNMEYRIRRPDGSVRWLADRGFPIRNAAGQPYRSAGIAQDVTERKRLEDNLRRSQKMEAIGQLAGGIAHDFNNILGCIVGYAEMAALETADNELAQSSLQEVLRASQRAKELVLQILTFSRQQEQGRKAIRLKPVVQEALKLLRPSLPSTVIIHAEIPDETPPVLADATQIHQVIMNLATNAVHAMEGKGDLTVALSTCTLDEAIARTHVDLLPGEYVSLTVEDNGCGMNHETAQRIFEPFFTTKAPGEGTGLGLAVVHGIMKSHEGAIAVYSEPGQGSHFRLYFPVIHANPEEPSARAETLSRGHGERVLLVDDEPSLMALCKKILEHAGYEVCAHTSVLDALQAFRAAPQKFDLVITDLTMPNLNGADFARELLKLRPDLPIILATGFGGAMTTEKAQGIGIREVLMKPTTARVLSDSVHRVLAGTGRG